MIKLKARGLYATYLGKDRWTVVGRGPRRTMTHAELRSFLEGKRK